jgi:hypothetical protein
MTAVMAKEQLLKKKYPSLYLFPRNLRKQSKTKFLYPIPIPNSNCRTSEN